MGTPFVPTPTGDVIPAIPPVDFKAVGQSIAAGLKDSGTWADKTATEIAAAGDLIARSLEWFCGRIAEVGAGATTSTSPALKAAATCIDSGLSIMVGLQTAMQGEGTTGFFQFLAALLSDLLGVEVPPESMLLAFKSGGRVAGMEAAGKGLTDLLVKELTAGQAGTLTASTAGVETFMGFVLAFTVREANIEFLSSLAEHIPVIGQYLKFDDARAYAVTMAENLGLGRLTRLALRPLFNILAVQPATWALNKKYRPTHFKEQEILRHFHRNKIEREPAKEELRLLGYSDTDADIMLDELTHPLNADQLLDNENLTFITRQQAIDYLVSYGWDKDEATNTMAATERLRLRPHYRTILDHVFNGVVGGFISIEQAIGIQVTSAIFTEGSVQIVPAQVKGIIGVLPLTDSEKQVISYSLAVISALPRAYLSVAELKAAWIGGFIDLETWRAQMTRHGYEFDSVNILMEQMLLSKPTATVKAVHQNVSLADAKKALKTGLWTLSTFESYLKKVGYDAEGIKTLVGLYGPLAATATPAPGATAPPDPGQSPEQSGPGATTLPLPPPVTI